MAGDRLHLSPFHQHLPPAIGATKTVLFILNRHRRTLPMVKRILGILLLLAAQSSFAEALSLTTSRPSSPRPSPAHRPAQAAQDQRRHRPHRPRRLGARCLGRLNPAVTGTDPLVGEAIAKAGSAAFLSSDNNAFSSRTAGFIVQQHFPPGVQNTPPGPLVGVNFSQLAFSDINKFKGPGSVISYGSSPGSRSFPRPVAHHRRTRRDARRSAAYKNGHLVGGVGIAGNGVAPTAITPALITGPDSDEDVALAAQTGFAPSSVIFGSGDLVNGIPSNTSRAPRASARCCPSAACPARRSRRTRSSPRPRHFRIRS